MESPEDYKDRGVVFYAVDLGDDPQTVKDFSKSNSSTCPCCSMPRVPSRGKYQASAIPQTVLIGKDGKIQVVHVGYGGE